MNDKPLAPGGINKERHSRNDLNSFSLASQAFVGANIPLIDKLESFPRFATKRSIARFLAKT
jgi:hypothetical protein